MKIRKGWIFLFASALLVVAAVLGVRHWWLGGGVVVGPDIPASHLFSRYDNLAFYSGTQDRPADLRLDVVAPNGVTGAPVVIILFGGAWISGHRRIPPVQNLALWLAERGVIGVAMDYRLIPHVTAEEQPRDVARGIAWVLEHIAEYGGDPAKIFFLGHSAGAHLASLVGCDRTYLNDLGVPAEVPAGVMALAGVFDVQNNGAGYSPFMEGTLKRAFGQDDEARRRLSPVVWIDRSTPPFLLLRPKGDHLVPKRQSENMRQALSDKEVPVEDQTIAGRDHVGLFDNMTAPGDLAGQAVLSFIEKYSAARN